MKNKYLDKNLTNDFFYMLPFLPSSLITHQTAMKKNQRVPKKETRRDYLHDDFIDKKELWIDFMADTGDGGNSTYTVARLLAQREIKIDSSQKEKYKIDLDTLKRGDLLLIGGDLA